MPRPHVNNELLQKSVKVWNTVQYTFIVLENSGIGRGYIVKVFPHDENESFWLHDGPWETESGTAWSILNFLDDNN